MCRVKGIVTNDSLKENMVQNSIRAQQPMTSVYSTCRRTGQSILESGHGTSISVLLIAISVHIKSSDNRSPHSQSQAEHEAKSFVLFPKDHYWPAISTPLISPLCPRIFLRPRRVQTIKSFLTMLWKRTKRRLGRTSHRIHSFAGSNPAILLMLSSMCCGSKFLPSINLEVGSQDGSNPR